MIPIDPRAASNFLGSTSGRSVDGGGNDVAYGGFDDEELIILARRSGVRRRLKRPLGFSLSQQLTGSGGYYLFDGLMRDEHGALIQGLVRLNTQSSAFDIAPPSRPVLFRADRNGHRVAYMQRPSGPDTPPQYFLYDFDTGSSMQLSDSPDAIDVSATAPRCVLPQGGTPVITGDGERVIAITPSTLGLSEQPWVEGACNVLEYSIPERHWRRLTTLPPEMLVEFPVIDDAGTLLSFIATEPFGAGGSRTTPQLLSLETGEFVALPEPLYAQAGFDSVVTRDGTALVVSSRADLDPLGSNADHNMEIFRLPLLTMTFEQVTFTTGGIGASPGGCPAFNPSRNDDGTVLIFGTPLVSVAPCQLDGPTRDERTGMVLGRVRTVPRRAGNRRPTMNWAGSTTVGIGSELLLHLTGEDPDGDPLTFYANPVRDAISLPDGTVFTQDGPEAATLRFRPNEAQRGVHDWRLALFDEGGDVVTMDVQVTVCGAVYDTPCRARSVAAIFGAAAGACGDVNGDGLMTAADLVAVTQRAQTCIPEAG